MPTKQIQPTSVLTKWKQTVKLLKSPDAKALKSSDRLSIFNQLLKDIKNVNGLHAQIYLTYFIEMSHLVSGKDVKYALNNGNKNKIFKKYGNHGNFNNAVKRTNFSDYEPSSHEAKDYVNKFFTSLSSDECDTYINNSSFKRMKKASNNSLMFIYYDWYNVEQENGNIIIFSASNDNLVKLLNKCINIYITCLDFNEIKDVTVTKAINKLIPKMTSCGKFINHIITLHLLKKNGFDLKGIKRAKLSNPYILDPKMQATNHTVTIFNYHATKDVYDALEKIQSEYAQSLISNSFSHKNGQALINCICASLEQLNMINIKNLFIIKSDVPLCIKSLYIHHKISITQALTIAITAINSAKALNMHEQNAGNNNYSYRNSTYTNYSKPMHSTYRGGYTYGGMQF